jgi:hypothetical protein
LESGQTLPHFPQGALLNLACLRGTAKPRPALLGDSLVSVPHVKALEQNVTLLPGEHINDYVQQPTSFEFVINMKTAQASGLSIPVPVQLLANRIIE